MGMFDKAKDVYKLQKQAKELKKELKNIHVEAESNGITITVTGEQEFVSATISDEAMQDTRKLERGIVEAANKAVKKSQQIGAEKMKAVMGDFGGLFGNQ